MLRVTPLVFALFALACGEKDAPDTGDTSPPPVDGDGDGYDETEDCNDNDPNVNPGVDERCDLIDWNCDGTADLGAVDAPLWYLDSDGDGFGGSATTLSSCDQPGGFVDNSDDCDDRDANVNPDGVEVCDRDDADEDCDGLIDDADDSLDLSTAVELYPDADEDGYGEAGSETALGCDVGAGLADNDGDCDDGDASINPGEEEVCGDGVDQDCDGTSNTCGPNGEVSLSAYASASGAAGDQVGTSLAGGVDVTGDGALDVIVGATQAAGSGSGEVHIFSGALSSPITLTGSGQSTRAGNAVSSGDVDGDGLGDLIVGASNYASGSGFTAYLEGPVSGGSLGALATDDIFGGISGELNGSAVLILHPVSGSEGAYVYGQPGLDQATLVYSGSSYVLSGTGVGVALARADVDGDGLDAVLLGAPDDGNGFVYVDSDPTSEPTRDLASDAARLAGSGSGHRFGEAIAHGADADGDGLDDVLVGAPDANSNAGAAYLFLDEPAGLRTAGNADANVTGVVSGDRVGRALALVDVDGDSVADLIVGAPGLDVSGTDLGAALVFYGPLSGNFSPEDADAVLYGESNFASAGSTLAGAGDIDGDGYEDFVVGAPGQDSLAGAVYLVLGGGI